MPTDYAITMQSIPEISEAEKRRRISRAYEIILQAGRRARQRQQTADAGDAFQGNPAPAADEHCPEGQDVTESLPR